MNTDDIGLCPDTGRSLSYSYKNLKCRCDACVDDARRRAASNRAANPRKYREAGATKEAKRRREDPAYTMYGNAKQRAKRSGIEFTISKDDIRIPETCPVLGISLATPEERVGKQKDNSPSLDRIDSRKGYTPDNVWVVSYLANRMMSNATPEQLLTFAASMQRTFGD